MPLHSEAYFDKTYGAKLKKNRSPRGRIAECLVISLGCIKESCRETSKILLHRFLCPENLVYLILDADWRYLERCEKLT